MMKIALLTLTLSALALPALADHPPLYQEPGAGPAAISPPGAAAPPSCPEGYEPTTSYGRPAAIVRAAAAWRKWQDFCRRVDSNPGYQLAGVLVGGGAKAAAGPGAAHIGRLLKIARTSAQDGERAAAAVRAVESAALRNLAREVPAVCAGAGCQSAALGRGMVNVAARVQPAERVAVAVSHCVGGPGAPGCGTVVVSTAAVVGNAAPRLVTQVERVVGSGGRVLGHTSGGNLPAGVRAVAGDMARDAMAAPRSTGFSRSSLTVAGQ